MRGSAELPRAPPGARRLRRTRCSLPGAGIEPARGFPQGIFVPLQLSPLHVNAMHLWSGLYLCHPVNARRGHGLGRGRQVSTLSLVGHMRRPKYSPEQLKDAVRTASSFRQVLTRLNVAPFGGNYDVLRRSLRRFDIDTSHFTGRAWSRGQQLRPRKPLDTYLANAAPIQSFKLKRRLLRAGVFKPRCERCSLTVWQGLPIPLELDHINGNNGDNRLENLRLLCPNCHALTPTYRSKRRTKA